MANGNLNRIEQGSVVFKMMALVVYNVAWADAYLRAKCHLDPSAIWPQ